MFNIVLFRPEIPHNTGAAGRLALATGSVLHLIKPLGFSVDDTAVKRAGLDYWKDVEVKVWDDWEHFMQERELGNLYLLTTKTQKSYFSADFKEGDYLVFGPESKGLPEKLLDDSESHKLTIPMKAGSTRSLNLATAVSIVLYEGVRQVGL